MCLIVAACDQGKQRDQPIAEGPPVNLVGANVGKDSSGKDLTIPANGAVQLQFDRLLLPITVTRQTVLLLDGSNNAFAPVVAYDPVARVVTLSKQEGQDWLKADQQYYVVLRTPTGANDDGIRAIDGAPLVPVDRIGFLAAAAAPQAFAEPPTSFCNDVMPLFQRCTAPQCHGHPTQTMDKTRFGDTGMSAPAAGLILETSAGVANTAIGRVANGANTGPRSAASEPSRVFGVDAPIVEPGNPGNSWLMYKLLLAKPGDPAKVPVSQRAKCDGTPGTPPIADLQLAPLSRSSPSDAERAILSDFVPGREMPYPNIGPDGPVDTNPGLTFGELERVRLWIAQGAPIQECGACEP